MRARQLGVGSRGTQETGEKPSRSTGRQRETVTAKVVGVVGVSVCFEEEPAGFADSSDTE